MDVNWIIIVVFKDNRNWIWLPILLSFFDRRYDVMVFILSMFIDILLLGFFYLMSIEQLLFILLQLIGYNWRIWLVGIVLSTLRTVILIDTIDILSLIGPVAFIF